MADRHFHAVRGVPPGPQRLTMELRRQPVADGGNGFRLFPPSSGTGDLPLIAMGCIHGAPQRLHPLLSALVYVAVARPRSSRARLVRSPGSQRYADLPLVAVWVDDPAEPPAVLVVHGGRFRRARGDRLLDDAVGVFDHEQRSAGRAIDCAGAVPLHRRGRCRHPERCVTDAELGDDVVPLADPVKDGCTECGFVERDRFTRSLDPQLRLDTRHRAPLRSPTPGSLYMRGGQPATYSPRVA